MSFISGQTISELKRKMTSDVSRLGKLYRIKKNNFDTISVEHGEVEDRIADGWEVDKEMVTKTRLRKPKLHSRVFEDDVWCQLYDLGYRNLSYDDQFKLPYGSNPEDLKQIDVVAKDDETILLVECMSSERAKRSPSLKTEFEGLEKRITGFRRSVDLIFGKGYKVRYIFATRNLRIDPDGVDVQRLRSARGFFYNDNTFEYVKSLVKNYKNAAIFQFMGIIFKGESVSEDKIEIPAVEGSMGGKKYYMFSLEPSLLLKIGFVLHRTRANEAEMPTYQRLLVPSRLKGINKFINDGGYFPNSIIVNFSENRLVKFKAHPRSGTSKSRFGMLDIPNSYAIAYIIDGQHRVYGYAGTKFSENNTIPVVAFTNLESVEQLEIFMSINENQKAVSPSLRGTLERDLYWESDRVDTRMKALRSSIVIELSECHNGPLFGKIEIGEDEALLKFAPFSKGLLNCGLLPKARGNKYLEESTTSCLYDINTGSHGAEMNRAKGQVVKLLNLCFGHVEENYPSIFDRNNSLIISNRGAYAFISLVGSLNRWGTEEKGDLGRRSTAEDRFDFIQPYLDTLLRALSSFNKDEEESILGSYGTGGDTLWFRTFQHLVHKDYPNYEPIELIVWKERQDQDLQDRGRTAGVKIEKHVKKGVLKTLKQLFNNDWELEINSIKRKCIDRAEEERERLYKEGLGNKDIPWTSMFTIMDYKTIIEKFWAREPDKTSPLFLQFSEQFSLDIGEGTASKAKAVKWLSRFNSLRNNWAHEGTKEKGLSQEEVIFLEEIHDALCEES